MISGTTITVTFFGDVSSTGQIVGEPRTEVWEEDASDGLNTCERCVREIVATLDGDAPFPYDGAEGVHACEILLGVMASDRKNGAFVTLPMLPEDRDVAAKWA